MKKRFGKLIGLFMGTLLLISCGGGMNGEKGGSDSKEVQTVSDIETKYPASFEQEGAAVEGNILKVAIVSDSPFKGVFNGYLYSTDADDKIMKFTMDGAFPTDGELKLILDSDETPIKVSVDPEAKTVTYKINPKFKWSNGDPVTTKDIVKTYEIFANKDYILSSNSFRYDRNTELIIGIKEYNEGKADKISGLEVIDDSTMIIHLKEFSPTILWGGPFAGEFVNAKQFEGIPMNKIIESPALRRNPLSYGPYYIKDIIQGEKVVFEANPYYYKGEPKIKKLEIEILPPSQQVAAIKAGKYDLVFGAGPTIFPELEELDNIKILTRKELYLGYMGFKVGKWDAKNGVVVTDPNSKMYNLNLRKAMAYAIDTDAISKQFYHGLMTPASSPLNPLFPMYHDPKIEGYKLDIEKANKLLDDAGYKDVDGDGYREDPNGKPLLINLAMVAGGETSEPLSQYYIQQWKSIGLHVELVDGRLLEFNNYWERLDADDPGIDVSLSGMGYSSDPELLGTFGKNSSFIESRYTSEKLEKALEATVSNEALDDEKRIQFYKELEVVFIDELPVVPLLNSVEFLPVNKRIKAYDWRRDSDFDWSMIEFIAPEPIVDSKS